MDRNEEDSYRIGPILRSLQKNTEKLVTGVK